MDDRPTRDPIREAHRQWVAHGWADAADTMALVTSVTRAQQLLAERVERALKPHGLTFARFEVLRLLSFTRDRALPMTRLGSLLQVHPASVTSAVDRLETQGFVRRQRRSEDRRVVHAELTEAGAATGVADEEPQDAAAVNEAWEAIKAREKSERTDPADGVPPTLPALLYADKLVDRLARAGRPVHVEPDADTVGERLLALVVEARAGGVDPGQELRDAVRRRLTSSSGPSSPS